MLKSMTAIVFTAIQVLFICFGLYYFFMSIFGLLEKLNVKSYRGCLPEKKFAIFIPAYNEEEVIGNIVENLICLNYPRQLFDVYVIADNCTDKTVQIASDKGAKVLIRKDNKNRGKGHALKWAFNEIIFKKYTDYDAIVVFDADNLVSKNFLREMNNKLCEGYKVLQGYIDSKNPEDSWVTASYSIAFWAANRLFQCSRWNLGLSCEIGGTGFCVDTGILKDVGWEATCLVEDLEFTINLILNGIKVGWAHDAVVYDEKPITLSQSWSQRCRWMQGFADVNSRYFIKLIKKGIKEKNVVYLDCALYTLQPYLILLGGLMILVPILNVYMFDNEMFILTLKIFPNFFKVYSVMQLSLIPLSLYIDNKLSYKLLLYYPTYLLYCITWIPIAIEGILMMKDKEWIHTRHTRTLSIHELE
ncbi:MAG: glycosyltransferase family 2 protein [Clostridiales bacterium]|nr:glycosyltransferase family 2 protein [Clostridiales bacterium]